MILCGGVWKRITENKMEGQFFSSYNLAFLICNVCVCVCVCTG